jgi:hypothetical protein
VLLEGEVLDELRSLHDRNRAERRFAEASREQEVFWGRANRYLKWIWGLCALAGAIALLIGYLAYQHQRRLGNELIRKNDVLEKTIARLELALAEKKSLTTQLSSETVERLQAQAENYKLRREGDDSDIVSPRLARDPTLTGQWRLWQPGVTLKVRFLDGDQDLKAAVREHASEWSHYANLTFDFEGDGRDAPIRVTFEQPGSWALVGVDALTVPKDNPTVNLGLIRGTPPEERARIIRHEFGHVLGLIHEHQNPNATIEWNRDRVFEYYSSAPNDWSREMIEQTILRKFPEFEDPKYRKFDPRSIMMWPILEGLANITVGVNQDLSESDKRFAARLYPR